MSVSGDAGLRELRRFLGVAYWNVGHGQVYQEAYMVNESLSANELEQLIGTIGSESQDEVND